MIKKVHILTALLFISIAGTAQISVEVLAYPTEFALRTGTTYAPSVGQNPLVVRYTNVANDVDGSAKQIYVPVWQTSLGNTGITGVIPSTGNITSVAGGSAAYGPALGTAIGLHGVALSDATVAAANARIINYVDNADGTANFDVIVTSYTIAVAPDEVTEYTTFMRYFSSPSALYAVPVKEESGNPGVYELAGMLYNSGATAETEVNLLALGATLNTSPIEFSELSVYPNPTTGIVNISDLSGVETITVSNVFGQVVKSYQAQSSIDISELTPGVYFFQANNGLKRKIIKE